MATQPVHKTPYPGVPEELLVGDFSRLLPDPFNEVMQKLAADHICKCTEVCKAWSAALYSGPYADFLWERLFKHRYLTPFTFNPDHKETWAQAYKIRTMLHAGLKSERYASRVLQEHNHYISCLGLEGNKIVSYSLKEDILKIWDTASTESLITFQVRGCKAFFDVEGRTYFSLRKPRGVLESELAVLSKDSDGNFTFEKVADFENSRCIFNLIAEKGKIFSSSEGVIKVFNSSNWECEHTFECSKQDDGWAHIVIGQDRVFARLAWDREINVWNWETLTPLPAIVAPGSKPNPYTALHCANDLLFSAVNLDGVSHVIQVRKVEAYHTVLHDLYGHTRMITDLASMGNKLISSSDDCTAKIWNMDSGECLYTLTPNSKIRDFRIIDEYILLLCQQGLIGVWDMNNGGNVSQKYFPVENSVASLKMAINDQVGLVSSNKNAIHIWDLHPSDHAILEEIAEDVACSDWVMTEAMKRFLQLSQEVRHAIYKEMYEIIKPKLINDYWGCGEEAFLGNPEFYAKNQFHATVEEKLLALQNYLAGHNNKK